jgi:hypothetical protein
MAGPGTAYTHDEMPEGAIHRFTNKVVADPTELAAYVASLEAKHQDTVIRQVTPRALYIVLDPVLGLLGSFSDAHTHPVAQLDDATDIGKAILQAADAAAERALLDLDSYYAAIDDARLRPYLVYTGFMSQASAVADPVVAILENLLGADVVWAKTGTGVYEGTLVGAFPAGLTYGFRTAIANVGGDFGTVTLERTSDDVVTLTIKNQSGADIDLFDYGVTLEVEVRVYQPEATS